MRDKADRFNELEAVILGASFDTPEDNLAFADAEGFSFRLLSDADRSVGEIYGVVRDPDHQYADYPERHSYLIAPDGTIARAYDVTDIPAHAEHVASDLADLTKG